MSIIPNTAFIATNPMSITTDAANFIMSTAVVITNAAKIAKHSVKENITVKQAAIYLGFVERGEIDEETLNSALDVATMVGEH